MDDQQQWNTNIERLKQLRRELPTEAGEELAQLLGQYRQTKEGLAAVVADVDAASDCRECRGQCCMNGKYRYSLLDGLAAVGAETLPDTDFLQKPLCPYGSDSGCSMEAGLRPADCVLFVCDAIDGKLSLQARESVAAHERNLRDCIRKAAAIVGERVGMPLLLWTEK